MVKRDPFSLRLMRLPSYGDSSVVASHAAETSDSQTHSICDEIEIKKPIRPRGRVALIVVAQEEWRLLPKLGILILNSGAGRR